MHYRVLGLLACAALAACGGGGSSATPQTSLQTQPVQSGKPSAVQSIAFQIPISSSSAAKSSAAIHHGASAGGRLPLYVSLDTKNVTLVVDGQMLLDKISVSAVQTTKTITDPKGQIVTYTSATETDASGAGFYNVTASFDMFPGQHTIGLVLQAADGFVLSEDQETYTLKGGSNPAATMYLKGVVDSAFLCDQPTCTGQWQVESDGTYDNIITFASDHEGDAIIQQPTGNGGFLPFANGPISIAAADPSVVHIITGGGSFSDPGNAKLISYGTSNHWPAGHPLSFKCVSLGTTTVSMRAGPQAQGQVTGFNYSAPIDTTADPIDPANGTPFAVTPSTVWPTPNQIVGSVPTFQDFGNQITVNCDANLQLTIQ